MYRARHITVVIPAFNVAPHIGGVIKELIAALIGLLLVIGTMFVASLAALAALTGRTSDFQAAKDVLLVMTSLTGVVLGRGPVT